MTDQERAIIESAVAMCRAMVAQGRAEQKAVATHAELGALRDASEQAVTRIIEAVDAYLEPSGGLG